MVHQSTPKVITAARYEPAAVMIICISVVTTGFSARKLGSYYLDFSFLNRAITTQHVAMLCIIKKKSQTSFIPNFKDDMPTKPHPIPVAPKLHTMAKTEIIILYPFVMQSPPYKFRFVILVRIYHIGPNSTRTAP